MSETQLGLESRLESALPSDGVMGRLIRAKDWSATPLGPIDAWPQSLRTAVVWRRPLERRKQEGACRETRPVSIGERPSGL